MPLIRPPAVLGLAGNVSSPAESVAPPAAGSLGTPPGVAVTGGHFMKQGWRRPTRLAGSKSQHFADLSTVPDAVDLIDNLLYNLLKLHSNRAPANPDKVKEGEAEAQKWFTDHYADVSSASPLLPWLKARRPPPSPIPIDKLGLSLHDMLPPAAKGAPVHHKCQQLATQEGQPCGGQNREDA